MSIYGCKWIYNLQLCITMNIYDKRRQKTMNVCFKRQEDNAINKKYSQ